MRKVLFFFAITGWTMGFIVHVLAMADYDVAGKIPFFWLLHLGIFVVWVPTIFMLRNNEELKILQQSKKVRPFALFKILLKETPTWLRVIAIGGLIYAFLNFLLFAASQGGTPDIRDGQYVILDHGKLIKTITEQEYYQYKANEVRGLSGFWLAFYGFAAAVLFPSKQ